MKKSKKKCLKNNHQYDACPLSLIGDYGSIEDLYSLPSEKGGDSFGDVDDLLATLKDADFAPLEQPMEQKQGKTSIVLAKQSSVQEEANTQPKKNGNEDNEKSAYALAQKLLRVLKIVLINGILAIYSKRDRCYKFLVGDDADILLRHAIPEDDRDNVSSYKFNEMIRWLRSFDGLKSYTYEGLKKRKKYLNFTNAIIKIADGSEYKKSDDLFFEFCINAEYPIDHEPIGLNFKQFLSVSFEDDPERICRFQEILGLAISHIRDQKIMIFMKGSANSGKSIVLGLIRELVGEKFCSSLAISDIGDRFLTSELFGKWVNLGSEVGTLTLNRIDMLKRSTGNDIFTGQFKYQPPFSFRNTALLIFAMNEWPKMGKLDDPESVYSRIEVLPMTKSLSRDEWDENLLHKLLQEKDYIVKFAVSGLRRFIDNGYQFSPCQAANDIKNEYMLQDNSFLQFAHLYIDFNSTTKTASCTIEKAYKKYCEKYNITPVHSTSWSYWLSRQQGVENCRGITVGDMQNARGFKGVELIGGEWE